jgi:hypothetical protein
MNVHATANVRRWQISSMRVRTAVAIVSGVVIDTLSTEIQLLTDAVAPRQSPDGQRRAAAARENAPQPENPLVD